MRFPIIPGFQWHFPISQQHEQSLFKISEIYSEKTKKNRKNHFVFKEHSNFPILVSTTEFSVCLLGFRFSCEIIAEAAAPSQEMFEEHPSLEENEAEIAAPSQEMVEEHPSNETLVENWIENTFPFQELEEKEDVQDLIAGALERTKADYDMLLTISKHTLHSEIDFLPENMREGLSSEELRRDGEEKLETCAVLYCLMEQTCLLCQFENREEIRKQQHSQSQTQSHQ